MNVKRPPVSIPGASPSPWSPFQAQGGVDVHPAAGCGFIKNVTEMLDETDVLPWETKSSSSRTV